MYMKSRNCVFFVPERFVYWSICLAKWEATRNTTKWYKKLWSCPCCMIMSHEHMWSAVIGDGMQNWCQQMRTHPKFTTNNKYCLMSMNFATHQHNVIRRTFFYESDHLYGLLYGIWCDADANELRKSHATSDFINKINIVCCCPHGLIVVVNVYDPIFGKFPSDHQRWRRRRGKLGCSASEQWTLNE